MQASISSTINTQAPEAPVNSRNKVVVASLIGTAIEFFDFYIYATAAVLIFPHIFFPQGGCDRRYATIAGDLRHRICRPAYRFCAIRSLW
ncbi:hypothetical protein DZS_10240 [Dickeya ananatis]